MRPEIATIYKLLNPDTLQPYYVGATIHAKARMRKHCRPRDGKVPIFEVIEECELSIASNREAFWMDELKKQGFVLENKNKSNYSVNHGRKPVPDKKKIVALYVPESTLSKLEGVPGVQELAYAAIEKKLKVKK